NDRLASKPMNLLTITLLGCSLMTTTLAANAIAQENAAAAAADTADTGGASLVWTSNNPLIKQAIALLNDGKLKEAQTLLASEDARRDAGAEQAREEMQDLIVRLRHEYSLDETGLLAKL